MIWYYRLQQRLSITNGECTVILTVAFLFFLGFTVRYVQSQPRTLPPETYAEGDRHFAEGTGAPEKRLQPAVSPEPVPAVAATIADTSRDRKQPVSVDRDARLELNTATAAQLETLPRIGPKMAVRILEYRQAHGSFKSVQELERVRGIGKKTLALLEPLVYVENQN